MIQAPAAHSASFRVGDVVAFDGDTLQPGTVMSTDAGEAWVRVERRHHGRVLVSNHVRPIEALGIMPVLGRIEPVRGVIGSGLPFARSLAAPATGDAATDGEIRVGDVFEWLGKKRQAAAVTSISGDVAEVRVEKVARNKSTSLHTDKASLVVLSKMTKLGHLAPVDGEVPSAEHLVARSAPVRVGDVFAYRDDRTRPATVAVLSGNGKATLRVERIKADGKREVLILDEALRTLRAWPRLGTNLNPGPTLSSLHLADKA